MRSDLRALCRWQRAAPFTSAVAPPLLHGTMWSAWSSVVARQRDHSGCLCSQRQRARVRRIFFCFQVNRRWGSRHLRRRPIAWAMTASGTKARRIAARTMSESGLDVTGGSWDRGGWSVTWSTTLSGKVGPAVGPRRCFDLTSGRPRTDRAGLAGGGDGRRFVREARSEMPRPTRRSPRGRGQRVRQDQ